MTILTSVKWYFLVVLICISFFGRNDAKAETPVFWPPHANSWLIGKDSDAGRDWGQEEKGMTEDKMAGWHHRPDGCEFEWTPGVGDGQGGLACCNSWGCKESDTTEWLNWTELNWALPWIPTSEKKWLSSLLKWKPWETHGSVMDTQPVLMTPYLNLCAQGLLYIREQGQGIS